VSKFLSEAHSQVDPYYQSIMDSKINDINSALSNLATNFKNSQGQTIQDFQTNLASERNTSANNGIAFSGLRNLGENNMAASTNRTLANLQSNAEYNIGNALRTGALAVGNSGTGPAGGVNSFVLPDVVGASVGLGGERGTGSLGGGLSYDYNPSSYNIGSIGSAANSALVGTANQFLSSYLGSAANNSAKSFQLVNGVPTLM
jgi:hypothetical protein